MLVDQQSAHSPRRLVGDRDLDFEFVSLLSRNNPFFNVQITVPDAGSRDNSHAGFDQIKLIAGRFRDARDVRSRI